MLDGKNHHDCPSEPRGSYRIDMKGSGNPAPDWYLEHFNPFAGRCADLIAGRIGRGDVRAVILGGSFALGEGSVFIEGGKPTFLSDVDLLVIVDSREALFRALAMKNELGAACEGLFPEAVFSGRVDVGAVTIGELPFFPKSPGVYNIRHCGRVLYGSGEVLREIPDFGKGELDPHEAAILLENRMSSLLGCLPGEKTGSEPERREFMYQIARAYTDILAAVLVAAGEYLPGYRERLRFASDNLAEGKLSEFIDPGTVDRAGRWTEFKINPSAGMSGIDAGSLGEIWLETAGETFRTWARIASRVAGRIPAGAPLQDTESIFRDRKSRMKPLDNLRSWKILIWERGLKDGISLIVSKRALMLKASPAEEIRKGSVILMEKALREGTGCAVDSPPGDFPYAGGQWLEAAESCHAAWRKLVFGRSDG